MRYYKGMPVGLWIIAVAIILFDIYYYIRPLLWGADFSIYASRFTLSTWALFVWFHAALDIVGIYAVTVGFYNAKKWARYYVLAIFVYSTLWNVYLSIGILF